MSPVALAEIRKLTEWALTSTTGELSELDWNPSDAVWRAVSVGSDECPGAERCPRGDVCFAERARNRAAYSDIIVVNTHLYGMHIRSGGALLPPHDVVVFDEAHVLEDVISDTIGAELFPGRFLGLAGVVGAVLADQDLLRQLVAVADTLRDAFAEHVGQRLKSGLPDSIREPLTAARLLLGRISEVLIGLSPGPDAIAQKLLRAQTMLGRTIESLDIALGNLDGSVAFVSGRPEAPRLEIAPLDVGPALLNKCGGNARPFLPAPPSRNLLRFASACPLIKLILCRWKVHLITPPTLCCIAPFTSRTRAIRDIEPEFNKN
jgi:ATP-dependent DNA helicase DinG